MNSFNKFLNNNFNNKNKIVLILSQFRLLKFILPAKQLYS